jgi:hypothetical protein
MYNKWAYYQEGMAHLQVSNGGDKLQICRVVANMLNKQAGRDDKEHWV